MLFPAIRSRPSLASFFARQDRLIIKHDELHNMGCTPTVVGWKPNSDLEKNPFSNDTWNKSAWKHSCLQGAMISFVDASFLDQQKEQCVSVIRNTFATTISTLAKNHVLNIGNDMLEIIFKFMIDDRISNFQPPELMRTLFLIGDDGLLFGVDLQLDLRPVAISKRNISVPEWGEYNYLHDHCRYLHCDGASAVPIEPMQELCAQMSTLLPLIKAHRFERPHVTSGYSASLGWRPGDNAKKTAEFLAPFYGVPQEDFITAVRGVVAAAEALEKAATGVYLRSIVKTFEEVELSDSDNE